jgi:hypothetical protein
MGSPRRTGRARKPSQKGNYAHLDDSEALQQSIESLPAPLRPAAAEGASAPQEVPQIQNTYTPIEIIEHAAEIHLPEGTRTPFEIFSLFWSPELIDTIVTNTNSYARRTHTDQSHKWKDVNTPELYVFFGIIIYMGTHEEPHMHDYWRQEANVNGPQHAIHKVMSKGRYYQIRQNLTLWDRGEPAEHSDCWYRPIEPLIDYLREAFREYFIPGTGIAIDEGMAKSNARSIHTSYLPGKPIEDGYKVWLAGHFGYIFAFELYSSVESSERSKEPKPLISKEMWKEAYIANKPPNWEGTR